MKKMKLRCLVALITAMMTAMAGCGSSGESSSSSEGSSETSSAAETSETSEVPENLNLTGYPIVNDKITLNFAVVKTVNHDDFATIPTVVSYEEKSNIHIEWEAIPQAGLTEKVNLMFASNKLADAFYGPVLTVNDISKYSAQGVLAPMDDLIDQYAPNLKAILEENDDIRKSITMPDGHIYSLFQYNWAPHGQVKSKIFINQEWLDTLNLKAPDNLEEFKEVLIAFRDGDPNGNGQKDEIPFAISIGSEAGAESLRDVYAMMAPWGVWADIMIENQKVVAGYTQEGFKDALKFYQELYKDGLMDAELFTQANDQFIAKGSGEDARYGIFYNHMASLAVGTNEDQYVGMAPLTGVDGNKLHPVRQTESSINRFVISETNPYKEATMRWVDYLYTEQGMMEFSRGPEGVAWERMDDGTIELLPTPEGMVYAKFRQTQSCGAISPFYKPEESNLQFSETDAAYNEMVEELYYPYAPAEVPPNEFVFTEDEIKQVDFLSTTISPYISEFIAKCITGVYDVEAEWPKYLESLQNMKNDELIQMYQQSYDRYLES